MNSETTPWWNSLIDAVVAPGPFRTAVLAGFLGLGALVLVWVVWVAFSTLIRAVRKRPGSKGIHLGTWKLSSPEQVGRGVVRLLVSLRWLAVTALTFSAAWGVILLFDAGSYQIWSLVLGIWAAQATLTLWWLLFRGVKALGTTVLLAVATQEKALRPWKIGQLTVLSAHMLEKGLVALLRTLGWAAVALVSAMTLTLVLGYFSYTWSWSQALVHLFSEVGAPVTQAVVAYLPSLGAGLLVVVAAWVVLKLLKAFFREWQAGRLDPHDPERAVTTYKLLRLAVILLACVMVFPYVPGSDSEAFRSVAIFLGVLVSLGSSSFVGNVMAGISLTYMAPFRAGDRVKIGTVVGDVVERTLLVTRVKTIKNELVTIPNALVVSREVENFSVTPQRPVLIHFEVSVGFEQPWRQVHEILLEAAASVPGILADPLPFVLQRAFGDFSVHYELNAATGQPQNMLNLESDLRAAVQDGFQRAGLSLTTPSHHIVKNSMT